MFKALKRITYHVSDLDEAKKWYAELLDSQPILDTPFVIIFRVGDCTLSLSKTNNPNRPESEQAEIYWEVDDIDSSLQKMIDMGAKEHMPITDRLNIRIAKVIDPFGNIIGITGSQPEVHRRSVENRPSDSAMVLAFCRALAFKDEREEIKGSDYLAECFLTEESKKPLKDSASRKWAIEKLITSPKYGYSISRTAYIDAIFKKCLSENIPQIVILGAGYDTRPYRFNALLGSTKIFEVDISTTQIRKIDILKSSKIEIPANVTFVAANFEAENLEERLLSAGFVNEVKTLYILEGVTYYLAKDTVIHIFDFIKTHSPKSSVICFDYLADKIESMNTAESYKFIISKKELITLLSACGFEIIEHIDHTEAERRYLTLKDGFLAEESLPHFNIVTAMAISFCSEFYH